MNLNIKRLFFTGLLIWTPVVVTFWVVKLIFLTLDGLVDYLPSAWQPSHIFGADFNFFGVGFLFSLLILFVTGLVGSNFVGRRFVSWGEGFIRHIPLINTIYISVKQVSDTILMNSKESFGQVVLVDHWGGSKAIGFVTGVASPIVVSKLEKNVEYINVFIPTAPNPTSGFFIILPVSEVIFLPLGVDQALKHVISMGSVNPCQKEEKEKGS